MSYFCTAIKACTCTALMKLPFSFKMSDVFRPKWALWPSNFQPNSCSLFLKVCFKSVRDYSDAHNASCIVQGMYKIHVPFSRKYPTRLLRCTASCMVQGVDVLCEYLMSKGRRNASNIWIPSIFSISVMY